MQPYQLESSACHPWWYYRKYSTIFGRREKYAEEISLILRYCSMAGKQIREVGAGTGEHAEQILKHNPSCLELVDIDEDAVQILRERFRQTENVKVYLGNGFSSLGLHLCDIAVCFYSIIMLSASSIEELERRLRGLLASVSSTGTVVFEAVDAEISQQIYPPDVQTPLYAGPSGIVTIRSLYSGPTYSIIYEGILDNQRISYMASMLAATRQGIEGMIRKIDDIEMSVLPLDDYGRRLLWILRRKS